MAKKEKDNKPDGLQKDAMMSAGHEEPKQPQPDGNAEEKTSSCQPQADETEKLQCELQELNERYMRLAAEYDNFRKRSQRERDSVYPDAIAAAVREFLPVSDNFALAIAAECIDPEYKKGTEMTAKSLEEAFCRLKVESFGEVGDRFDPKLHYAVMHIEDESVKESTVVEVFQRGYKIGDRVLRVAMVKVAN